MPSKTIDIHPHAIASDEVRYPRDPLFGVQSTWSHERPVTIDQLAAAMDEAGVDKAAIVQASTCYGFDNSYVCDAVSQYPRRFTAVGSIDMLAPDAVRTAEKWAARGLSGLRVFTGGSTAEFDTSALDDRRSFPVWEFCAQTGISMCLQTGPVGLAQVAGLAKRFPTVKIIMDHLARPDLADGPPYARAVSLFALSAFDNIYLKITPNTFALLTKGHASATTFLPKLVAEFGANRIAWGSNFPASAGKLSDNLATVRQTMSVLSEDDRSWIFARTAQRLYPALAD
jgi:L-fuconolactonase